MGNENYQHKKYVPEARIFTQPLSAINIAIYS